ncbi:hypothetical protein CF15_08175 [Pyrodictium occultum]|uniref:NAD-dependent epimerase/dehydratase domain-containing protein n=1 Tax=Pyrodictium occultum TaxID=2309 RepID=A0A0V8RRJ7_PYROC|nr:NAD-dependent epimerase/dehydratase family protein [Pyrodictium occultum]KSW10748.1 hypothetical protein CF15_08175 [Pyrodictium occultum]
MTWCSTTLPTPRLGTDGATKAAAETMVGVYAGLYGLQGLVLRYANIVGPRLRHGVIHDFIVKLRESPQRLEILGDGSQRKSYLHVADAVEATMAALDGLLRGGDALRVYNVGNRGWITVEEIARIVEEEMGLAGVEHVYRPATPGGRGWPRGTWSPCS